MMGYSILFPFISAVFVGVMLRCGANHQPGDSVESEEFRCDRLVAEIQRSEQKTIAKLPPDLTAKWISQRCEVRSGPEFLLRSYTFYKNHTFHLTQFYYMDPSCTQPIYSVTAEGKYELQGASWMVTGATEMDYVLHRVKVVPYSAAFAEDLSARVNFSCLGTVSKLWKPHRPYIIYNYAESNWAQDKNTIEVVDDLDCTSSLHLAFHELQLVRMEIRPYKHHGGGHGSYMSQERSNSIVDKGDVHVKETKTELLLGNIHSRIDNRAHYRPNSYQVPLMNSITMAGCHTCRIVHKADELHPPHLHATQVLPINLAGEWISAQCEVRPLGMFLMRRLRFFEASKTWQGIFQYYTDPQCMSPTYNIIAGGMYTPGSASSRVAGGTDCDFKITNAMITPQDKQMVANLNSAPLDNTCGRRGLWRLGEPQDITASYGCAGIGIKIPSTEYEIIKMEIDHKDNRHLFLGQTDTNNRQFTSESRATSYQPPLIQCRVYDSLMSADASKTVVSARGRGSDGLKTSKMHTVVSNYFDGLVAYDYDLNSGKFTVYSSPVLLILSLFLNVWNR